MEEMLTAAEMKPLTKKERAFVENIVRLGVDRVEAFSMAFDEAYNTEDEYENMKVKATRRFYKPHIQTYYKAVMQEVRDAETRQAVWNKELSTEKLLSLVNRVEGELEDGGNVSMARQTAMINAIKELNTMHGLQAPTKIEAEGGFVLHILEDTLED